MVNLLNVTLSELISITLSKSELYCAEPATILVVDDEFPINVIDSSIRIASLYVQAQTFRVWPADALSMAYWIL